MGEGLTFVPGKTDNFIAVAQVDAAAAGACEMF